MLTAKEWQELDEKHRVFYQGLYQAACDSVANGTDSGFCVECMTEHDHIEADGRNYECCSCGRKSVFGAEEIIGMFA